MFEQVQLAYECLTAAIAEAKARGHREVAVKVETVGGTDDEKVLLMIQTQTLLCERFPDEIGGYKYPAYPLLLRVLAHHCPPVKGSKYEDLDGRLLVAASKLAYASCLISPLNAEELIAEGGFILWHAVCYCWCALACSNIILILILMDVSSLTGGIEVLNEALVKCLARVDPLTNPKGNHEMTAIAWLAHSLSGLLLYSSKVYTCSFGCIYFDAYLLIFFFSFFLNDGGVDGRSRSLRVGARGPCQLRTRLRHLHLHPPHFAAVSSTRPVCPRGDGEDGQEEGAAGALLLLV